MSIKKALVLSLAVVLMIGCVTEIKKQPENMEYLFLSPPTEKQDRDDEKEEKQKGSAETAIEKIVKLSDSWQGIISRWTVTSENERVSLSSDKGSKQAHLTGFLDKQPLFPDRLIRFGRDFYPDELKKGEKVILLDEKLALELFRIGDPVDRKVNIGGTEYRVIGIFRHRRSVGESENHLAFVPLKALDNTHFQTQVLKVTASAVPSAGAQAMFRKDMEGTFPGGTFFHLGNEQYRALLPIRYLLSFLTVLLLMAGFKKAKQICLGMTADYRKRLEREYAQKLIFRGACYVMLGISLYAALIFLSFAVIAFAIHPVYIFPEWVPAVPVEWTEISKTFWNNRSTESAMIEIRSVGANALRFYRDGLTVLSVLTGSLLLTEKYQYRLRKLSK